MTTEPSNFNTTAETPFYAEFEESLSSLLAITMGNVLALVLLFRNRREHKWSIFYRLLLILVLADFTGQGTTSSMIFLADVQYITETRVLCGWIFALIITTSLINVLLGSLLSVDRFIESWSQNKYSEKSKIRCMYIAVFVVIAISFSIGCLLPGDTSNELSENGTSCFVDLVPADNQEFLYICASIGIIAVASMLVMNVIVVGRVCYLFKRKERPGSQMPTPNYDPGLKDILNICFLILITIAFMVRWIPFIKKSLGITDENEKTEEEEVQVKGWHQVLSPWVYVILRYLFSALFRKCGKKCCKAVRIVMELQETVDDVPMSDLDLDV